MFQMKLPTSVGQKKIKAIEQMLTELEVGEYRVSYLWAWSYQQGGWSHTSWGCGLTSREWGLTS